MAQQDKYFLTIDNVAKQLGITPRTLRYYEEVGLISAAARTNGGHRLYDEKTIDMLQQILRLKEHLGISLQEIQETLSAEQSLQELKKNFQEQNENIEEQKRIVQNFIQILEELIEKMNRKIENIQIMKLQYQERMVRAKNLLKEIDCSEE